MLDDSDASRSPKRKRFPAIVGKTKKGNFYFGGDNLNEAVKLCTELTAQFKCDSFCGLIPEKGDKIHIAKKGEIWFSGGGLIYRRFNNNSKKILILPSDNYPTILLSNNNQHLIGIIHSGWENIKAGVLQRMKETIGDIEDMNFVIVCNHCYAVGQEQEFERYFPHDYLRGRINIANIAYRQLLELGALITKINIRRCPNSYCKEAQQRKAIFIAPF